MAHIDDVVYTNGEIYTVNGDQPWVEAVAIRDGDFIAVGSSEDAAAYRDVSREDIQWMADNDRIHISTITVGDGVAEPPDRRGRE